jgi:hypothetical protein
LAIANSRAINFFAGPNIDPIRRRDYTISETGWGPGDLPACSESNLAVLAGPGWKLIIALWTILKNKTSFDPPQISNRLG